MGDTVNDVYFIDVKVRQVRTVRSLKGSHTTNKEATFDMRLVVCLVLPHDIVTETGRKDWPKI